MDIVLGHQRFIRENGLPVFILTLMTGAVVQAVGWLAASGVLGRWLEALDDWGREVSGRK